MNDLHVDSHLAAVVGDNQDTDAAAARLKSFLQAAPQTALINDRQVLLDVAGLGHGNDVAILHVQDTVLLEDRADHGLDDDARGRVGDERRLLMQLLSEEVDTKVAVLAGGSRGRDADDLARAALEDEDVAEADVVARDGHRVGRVRDLGSIGARAAVLTDLGDLNTVLAFMVHDTVSQLVQSLTERVVAAWAWREHTCMCVCVCEESNPWPPET